MNLRDFRYLVALADHGSFGRAAEACFVSQPTLSVQIQKLEAELGVTLVERGSRQIMMTEVGERVVQRARNLLAEVDQIKYIARASIDPAAGSLRVGVFHTLGAYLFPHVIGRVHARFPELELLLTEDKTLELIQLLRDGKLDAALLAEPVNESDLHAEHLFNEPFVLATPEHHPLARKADLTTHDLRGEELLLLEDGHCLRDQALEICHMAGASERRGFRATSLEMVRLMVAADAGITLLPILAVQPPITRTENVALTPFHGRHPPGRRVALYWRKSTAMHDFLLQVAEVFRAIPKELLDPASLRGK